MQVQEREEFKSVSRPDKEETRTQAKRISCTSEGLGGFWFGQIFTSRIIYLDAAEWVKADWLSAEKPLLSFPRHFGRRWCLSRNQRRFRPNLRPAAAPKQECYECDATPHTCLPARN